MIPRLGEAVRADQKYRIRPGSYAILVRKGHVLLTFQEAPYFEYQLPGGGVDPGEHPIPALHREVMEETGWKISTPKRVGVYRRFAYMPEYDKWAEKIATVYLATPTIRMGEPTEAGHHAVWFSPEEAIRAVESDGDRLLLSRVLF